MKLKIALALPLLHLVASLGHTSPIWTENFESIPNNTTLGSLSTTSTVISSTGAVGIVRAITDPYFGSTRALEIDRTPGSSRSITFTPVNTLGDSLSPVCEVSLDFYQNRRSATDSGSGGAVEHLRWSFKAPDGESIVNLNYRPDRGRLNTGNMSDHPTLYNTARNFRFFINNTDEEIVYLNPVTNEERTLSAATLEFFAEGDSNFTQVALKPAKTGEKVASFQFHINTGLNGHFFADNITISELNMLPERRTYSTNRGSGEVNLLQNGNFERRTVGTIPDSWTRRYSSAHGSSSRSNDILYYGDYSFKIEDGSSSNSEGIISDFIPVNPGVYYTVDGYMHRATSSSGGQIYVKYYDDSSTEVGSSSVSGTTVGSWQNVSHTARAPASATHARILCYSHSAAVGTVYFDAVSFIRSASQDMVDNSDMKLDTVGTGYPLNWGSNYDSAYTQTGSVSIASSGSNKYMVLTDTSTSLPATAMTRIPVIGNMTYIASAKIFWSTGNAPKLYVKYRNEYDKIVASDYVSPTTTGSWGTYNVTLKAPEDAVEAQVIAYIGMPETGVSYFDDVSLQPTGFVKRFIAPSALGAGTGTNASNAAKYNDPAFWASVTTLLQTQSVIIDVRHGRYNLNSYTNDRFHLDGVSSDDHALVLTGRFPYGTIFRRTTSADTSDRRTFMRFKNAKNLVLRHLHWEDNADDPAKISGYALIVGESNDPETKNIVIEGCSFVGLTTNYYGALGLHGPNTRRTLVWNCEFVNVGFSFYSHMIYNSYQSHDHQILNNYFEDSMGGSYVRHRDGCHDVLIADNRFVSTGSAAHFFPFIEIATFNDELTDNEKWGYNFSFIGNEFEFPSATNPANVAIRFLHYGYKPVDENNVEWDYLLTATERNTLLSGTTAQKIALIKNNFDLDFESQVLIEGNTRKGYHAYKMVLVSDSYWTWVPNLGGNGTYNISALEDL